MRRVLLGFSVFALAFVWVGFQLRAQAAVQGSVTIEQVSPGTYGTWMLYSSSGTVAKSEDAQNKFNYSFIVSEERLGLLTLSITPPSGSKPKVSVYRNGSLVKSEYTRQLTVQMYPGESYRFIIIYGFGDLGMLGITSNPNALSFRVRGPNKIRLSGKTPYTFSHLPFGRYTINMAAPKGCITPRPYNKVVRPDERTTLHVDIDCTSHLDKPGVIPRQKTKRDIIEESRLRDVIDAARHRFNSPRASSSSSSVSSSPSGQ